MGKGTVKIVGLSVVALLSYGAVMGFSSNTLVSPACVAVGCVAVTAALYPVCAGFWRKTLSVTRFWLPLFCHLVVATGLLMALFYLANFTLADKGTLHEESGVVESRYTETHYRSKRISRNHYVRGEPYKVYYLKVSLPGGWQKPMLVNLQKYKQTHVGDTLQIPVARGLFGFSVIKR